MFLKEVKNIVKNHYHLKKLFYICDGKAYFCDLAAFSQSSFTWSFGNQYNMLIFCSRNFCCYQFNFENNCAATYFCGNHDTFFFIILS